MVHSCCFNRKTFTTQTASLLLSKPDKTTTNENQMPLIDCPDCKKQRSDQLGSACPNCGNVLQPPSRASTKHQQKPKGKTRKEAKPSSGHLGYIFLGLFWIGMSGYFFMDDRGPFWCVFALCGGIIFLLHFFCPNLFRKKRQK
jgi:hypothetical protein